MEHEKTGLALKTLRDEFSKAVAADLIADLQYYEQDDQVDYGTSFSKLCTYFRIEGAMTAATLINTDPEFERFLESELAEIQSVCSKSLESLRPLLMRAVPCALESVDA